MKSRLNVVMLVAGGLGVGVLTIVGVTLFGPAPPDEGEEPEAIVEPEEGEDFGPICTLIGCTDGVSVVFAGDVPSDYHVDVAGEEGEPWQTDCHIEPGMAEGLGCLPDGGVHIEGITPQTLTITVTWDDGSKTETFEPDYQIVQPNGPQCDPTCRQATLTMTLP